MDRLLRYFPGGQNPGQGGPFITTYQCFSVSMLPGNERTDVDNGGKIILPPSALETMTRLNVSYPMLFKLSVAETLRETHCGVLEFVADEGKCYLPHWMMRNLLLEEGGRVRLETVELPIATFSKFQPQSVAFLDITDPKAILENAMRNFACLTAGDTIAIKYNDRSYELRVLETLPGNAVNIIECDMNVDFAPPVGYVEPQKEKANEQAMTGGSVPVEEPKEFHAFVGQGNRLDGKEVSPTVLVPGAGGANLRRGIPDYDWRFGNLTFYRPQPATNIKDDHKPFEPFSGQGSTTRG